jgi:hypothetical protein
VKKTAEVSERCQSWTKTGFGVETGFGFGTGSKTGSEVAAQSAGVPRTETGCQIVLGQRPQDEKAELETVAEQSELVVLVVLVELVELEPKEVLTGSAVLAELVDLVEREVSSGIEELNLFLKKDLTLKYKVLDFVLSRKFLQDTPNKQDPLCTLETR